MAIQGKFIINGADYSPLTLYGVGTFMAFSGVGNYRNNSCFQHIPEEGPLPSGRYYIVDRETGSWKNKVRAWAIDTYNSTFYYPVDHSIWFALYRIDGVIDDETFLENIKRSAFRLHPGRISKGCITLAHQTDFDRIRHAILQQNKEKIPGSRFESYGVIEVISNVQSCS